MEFPFLALQKRRTVPIEYSNGGVYVSVGADSRFSIATIWDWDVMIFAASHINAAIESARFLRRLPSFRTIV
jgi:Replication initiator protein A